jgi:hypothetical protein
VNRDILALADRVLVIEPQLRTALAAVRLASHLAISDVWTNLAWRLDYPLEEDNDFRIWAAIHQAQKVLSAEVDKVVAAIAANLEAQSHLDSDVEDSERRELSLQLYREYEKLRQQLIVLVQRRDNDQNTVDAADLSCARVLRLKVRPYKEQDERLLEIAQSAVDTALAVSHLAKRVAVVKAQPQTLAEADRY